MLYPTLAKVTAFEDGGSRQDSMVFFSTSYADAARRIEEDYKTSLLSIDLLELWEGNDFLYVNDTIIEELRKENY